MSISFNTSTSTTGGQNGNSQAITIPAGVLTGDVMIIIATSMTNTTNPPTISIVSSAGSTWTPLASPEPNYLNSSGYRFYSNAFYCVAGASDPSSTVTLTNTSTGSPGTFWQVDMAAYTGCNQAHPIDLFDWYQPINAGGAGSVPCPQLTTRVANEWALYLATSGNSSGVTGPSGSTQRQNAYSTNGIHAGLFDSNGSVGAAGTVIGGGSFSGSTVSWVTWTLGLVPAGSTPTGISVIDHGANHQSATASSVTFTIPPEVQTNDLIILAVEAFINSVPTLSVSGGGTWQQLGSQEVPTGSGYLPYSVLYYLVAGGSSAGQTVTINNTGTGNPYYTFAFGVYRNATVDVHNFATSASNSSITTATATTGQANDWAVFLCAGGPAISGYPAGSYYRDEANASGTTTAITDSGGSVGAANTTIGGGTFTYSGGSGGGVAWTVGIAPTATAPHFNAIISSFP